MLRLLKQSATNDSIYDRRYLPEPRKERKSRCTGSIHLCDFPAVDEAMIDEKLERDMGEVLDIVVLGRAARNASGIKNRQPIGQMFVNGEAL